jgi:hypothetical protein
MGMARLDPIKLGRVSPEDLLPFFCRHVSPPAVDHFPAARPGGGRLWEVGAPEDVLDANVMARPKADSVVPTGEIALASEQLRRLERKSLVPDLVILKLVVRVL